VDFDLYGDQPAKPYTFKLSPGSLARYLATGNAETIKILFLDPDKDNLQDPSLKSFQEVFNIQGIYETQTDLVEELILKSQIYTGSYKKALTTSFKKLLSNEKLANRMLIGNYMDLEDIHKRPMAKFIQDITIQLKMI
jgi:hypothetical protein